MKDFLKRNKVIIWVVVIAILFLGGLLYFSNSQSVSNKELYENTKKLNNFSTNLKVYIGASNAEEAATVLEQDSIVEDLENEIYDFTEYRKASYGSSEFVNRFAYKGSQEKQYFKISESNTKLIIPLNEWIETPNEEYKEINQANMDALRQSFSRKTIPMFVYDLDKLKQESSKNGKLTFDVSKDKEFQDYIEEFYTPINCYEDGPTKLLIEVEGKNIKTYKIENDCMLIEYNVSEIGTSKFERLGE